MAATAIHRLTLDPMGKCSNAFFSETTNIIKIKALNKWYGKFHALKNINLEIKKGERH
jgi:ABC-type uncharacterized transport system ATPase subunit